MQDTVAVALVTSLSTLTAAGITGLIGRRISRQQLTDQLAGAREERSEQWAARRGQLRRDAYMHFLSTCDQAYRRLDQRWLDAGGHEDEPRYNDLYEALRALDEAYNLILLEGPSEVAREAGLVIGSINAEQAEQHQLAEAAPTDGVPLADRFRAERLRSIEERAASRDSFIRTARTALDRSR